MPSSRGRAVPVAPRASAVVGMRLPHRSRGTPAPAGPPARPRLPRAAHASGRGRKASILPDPRRAVPQDTLPSASPSPRRSPAGYRFSDPRARPRSAPAPRRRSMVGRRALERTREAKAGRSWFVPYAGLSAAPARAGVRRATGSQSPAARPRSAPAPRRHTMVGRRVENAGSEGGEVVVCSLRRLIDRFRPVPGIPGRDRGDHRADGRRPGGWPAF